MRPGGPQLPFIASAEGSRAPLVPMRPLPAPSFAPRLVPTLAALWNESKILARLMYKNRHQHRAALYYRKFQKILRDMKALAKLEIVLQTQYERGGLEPERTQELFECVPPLCNQLKVDCQKCYRILEENYSEGYFVPLAMAGMALVARLNACLRIILDTEVPLAASKLALRRPV